jgi:ubiquinone/menaquinone biosynthesis C-methylase UbiE
MERTLEPELMEDPAQVAAYANADFVEPHNEFIERLKAFVNTPDFSGIALDLGCGSGDIAVRFLNSFPSANVHGVDGSQAMLTYAKNSINPETLTKLTLIHGKLPDAALSKPYYDIIFSNSLLHHLPDPQILWQTVTKFSRSGTRIVVMDLLRPDSAAIANTMVEHYASNEPEILRRDFYYSLLAAFTMPEIKQQLATANLPFSAEQIDDRHVFITGLMP